MCLAVPKESISLPAAILLAKTLQDNSSSRWLLQSETPELWLERPTSTCSGRPPKIKQQPAVLTVSKAQHKKIARNYAQQETGTD